MPLVSIGEELKRAQAGGYALPLFDTADVQSTEGMIQALEDRKAPAMIALYSGALERPNGRAMAAYIRTRAEEASVPISLMLDHGSSFRGTRMHAIAAGFTLMDVYDGSSLLSRRTSPRRRPSSVPPTLWACGRGGAGRGQRKRLPELGARWKGFTDPDTVERLCP